MLLKFRSFIKHYFFPIVFRTPARTLEPYLSIATSSPGLGLPDSDVIISRELVLKPCMWKDCRSMDGQ
jgi:hypothetical protein